ncbi:RpiR family transcriptional regulator [Bacillus oleivorans]|uniref:RpiR family transcriptional regulator n=1 Tax=Bacillus oleivorans TaxID=1448271 RepID=A0A285D4E4_9BACI|nr:MurR/RpiR family transcriptional regulator [Bacillus oleivorans]SNX74687.1 RpiR family transcriptional regulator [Bacillus oleivorans]
MPDIHEQIKEKFNTLSSAQKNVAHYIFENMEEAVVSSAQKIAEKSNVSEATVHRFAQALQFENFMEMKKEMIQFLHYNRRAVNNLLLTTAAKPDSWLEQHFLQEAENIVSTSKEISQMDIQRAAELLLSARRIWIGGWRMGLSITSFMQFVLNYMLGNCSMIPQGEAAEYTSYFQKGDLVLLSAFPRYDSLTLKIAELAKAKGVSVIGLTDSSLSPICKFTTIHFFAKTKSNSFLDSYTAALSICNAIINEVAYIGGERIKFNINHVEEHFEKFK